MKKYGALSFLNSGCFVMIIQVFVFEMQCGMNEFDHCTFLTLVKQQQERPKKFSDCFPFLPSTFKLLHRVSLQ